MTAQVDSGYSGRRFATRVVPFAVVLLAGLLVRTPLAAAYPLTALLLFLWIVSDTMMLSLLARASGRPRLRQVLGVLAGASVTVWLGAPPAVLQAAHAQAWIVAGMAVLVLAHVAGAGLRARRRLASTDGTTGERWIAAASEALPPALVKLAVAEITVIHMALFRWGGPADVPADSRAFAYHKHLTPICAALLILSAIEMATYHLLVGHWSRTAALAMFVISDIGFLYLMGLIKSFRFRPVLLTPEGLRIRTGFLVDQRVPLDAIAGIEPQVAGETVRDPATFNAALLAWPNIVLRLNHPLPRRALLRRKAPFSRIAFRLDEPEPFVRLLLWRLGQAASAG